MSQENVKSLMEQFNIFVRDSVLGYLRVILVGLGRRLGILQYLYQKANSEKSDKKIESVSFTFNELMTKLNLDERYLEAWLNAALEVGIFEVFDKEKKSLKTCSHVYEIFINSNSPIFLGTAYGSIYRVALQQEDIFKNFKTGKLVNREQVPKDIVMEGHRVTARMGNRLEQYFSKRYRDVRKALREGGNILEVGCGYGYNLLNWAKKYRNCSIIGIDIDDEAVSCLREHVLKNKMDDRIKIIKASAEKYEILNNRDKFDLIILNQVFHEMEIDDKFRKNVINNLYLLLKESGIILVGESIMEDIFDPDRKPQLFEALHKWQEVGLVSKFYTEKSFREFIASTSFKEAELIKEGDFSFWVLKK